MVRVLVLILIGMAAATGIAGAELVRLGYDDGSAEDAIWMDGLRGHAVLYDAPCENWTLSGVEILGKLAPEPRSEMLIVEIWDRNLSLLSRATDRARSYFSDNLTWSVVDIPDTTVSGSFLISVYEFAGVYVGVDNSSRYQRSALTARNPNRILPWDLENRSYNQTNWMIRALGSSPAPRISLEMKRERASQASPAEIRVMALDEDDNLLRAALYIIDNSSHEIVWSEMKPLEGGRADLEFSWPAAARQISLDGSYYGPVFAANELGVPENVSHLLAFSVPAILEGRENLTLFVQAYFGQDGRFNALIDSYGRAYYLSSDLVERTMPGGNYSQFAMENISLVPGESRIGFLKMRLPANIEEEAVEFAGPVLLAGSAQEGYGLRLEETAARSGEYIILAEVQDLAFNVVRMAGDEMARVA